MATNNNHLKIVTIVALLISLSMGVWCVREMNRSEVTDEQLQQQRLKSESLLSEKLFAEKQLDRNKGQLAALEGKNLELRNRVSETEKELADSKSVLVKSKYLVAEGNKKIAVLEAQKMELEKLSAGNSLLISNLESENSKLKKEKDDLGGQVNDLNSKMMRLSAHRMDRGMIEAVRGSGDKLVVKARRTQRIRCTVEVPVELKNITFTVRNPGGQILKEEDGKFAFTEIKGSAKEGWRQVELMYQPKKKLTPGKYQIEIWDGELPVGGLWVKLR